MEKIYKNEKLSKYSWFNLGGPAKVFFKPNSLNNLQEFLKENKENRNKIHILGAGSNTLFRDTGFDGLVIKLGPNFSYINLIDKNTFEVGAATLDKTISEFAKKNSITGFEFLSCIPGSIGGSIMMNSGCYGENISNIFVSLKAISTEGDLVNFNNKDIKFFYRGNDLKKDYKILSAVLKGQVLSKEKIEKKQNTFIEKKRKTQPSKVKTCGSTFKNPKNKKAWELIKLSECSNLKIGGASISDKHSNFFINDGSATSHDIESLINEVRKKVLEKTGTKLDLEIKIVGKK